MTHCDPRRPLYDVDLVDGTEGADTCTCQDFLGGLLGTCKHIHAVHRCIASRPRPASAWRHERNERAHALLGVRSESGLSLRLARVVLEAGFPADSVRAAYEALSSAIRALLASPVGPDHGALVAAVYKELIPTGRLAPPAHAALARLNDLAQLDAHGVAVDVELARSSLKEAEEWLARLEGGTGQPASA